MVVNVIADIVGSIYLCIVNSELCEVLWQVIPCMIANILKDYIWCLRGQYGVVAVALDLKSDGRTRRHKSCSSTKECDYLEGYDLFTPHLSQVERSMRLYACTNENIIRR